MKKFIIFVTVIFIFLLSSCFSEFVPEKRISSLDEDLLFVEGDGYNLTLYPETRETPYEEDGFVGKKEKYLIFRLNSTVGVNYSETPKITFELNGVKYNGEFEFRPVSYSLLCVIETADFPNKKLDVSLFIDGEQQNLSLYSVKKENTVSYNDIVKNLNKINNKSVSELISQPNNYEIRIRLLEDEGFNYWLVKIIGKEKSVELLFDAENGELIAVKEK